MCEFHIWVKPKVEEAHGFPPHIGALWISLAFCDDVPKGICIFVLRNKVLYSAKNVCLNTAIIIALATFICMFDYLQCQRIPKL